MNNEKALPEGWNSLGIIPPDQYLELIDADGRTAFGYPTYYPFRVEHRAGDERKPFGWQGTPVRYEDGKSRWDGGWMIDVSDLVVNKIGDVIGWKHI